MRVFRLLMGVAFLAFSGMALAAAEPSNAATNTPYDESSDAKVDVANGIAAAKADGRRVIVVFGANWCPDCLALDRAFKSEVVASRLDSKYRVVKVDVGRFTKNQDIADKLGVPLKKGIPAVAVVDGAGRPVYVTKAGELADARKMGPESVADFFSKIQ